LRAAVKKTRKLREYPLLATIQQLSAKKEDCGLGEVRLEAKWA